MTGPDHEDEPILRDRKAREAVILDGALHEAELRHSERTASAACAVLPMPSRRTMSG